jgi:hypothetical protein
MRKFKKVETMRKFDFWSDNLIKIDKEGENYYFEIGNIVTNDIAEAIAILMKTVNKNNKFWDIELNDINFYNISPEKSLYWLSGGDKEWRYSNNYKLNWIDCCLDYQEEFGLKIIAILKKSKTTGDVRNAFSKYLNLPKLYEFALEKGFA